MIARSRLPRLLLALLLFILAPSSFAETVNMFGGVPLGGFGDTASNVLMAQLLKTMRPELTVNFHVSPKQLKQIQVLLPDFDPKKGRQTIGGIEYFVGAANPLPRGDTFLGLSIKKSDGSSDGYAKDVFFPDKFEDRTNVFELLRQVSNAPLVFHFKEYGGSPYQIVSSNRNGIGGTLVFWETGPQAAGLYVTPGAPKSTMPREALDAELVHTLGAKGIQGRKIAFGYSAYLPAMQQYIGVMTEYAKLHPEERLALVVKDLKGMDVSHLPSNVLVVKFGNTPFELQRALIAHSDAPILVTGDTSLSLAIEYRKLFLYEANHWKVKSMRALIAEMAARSPYFSEKNNRDWLGAMFGLPGQFQKPQGGDFNKNMARKLSDDKFKAEQFTAMGLIKEHRSLPATLLKALDALHGLDLEKASSTEVHDRLRKAGIVYRPSLLRRLADLCASAAALFKRR